MPILSQDIKLLKSQVMDDTPEGGGAMTGNAVVDGQSNNLFPDTSDLDRAFGRVNIRQVYGVAHTSDTDTLLGAHTIITDAPDDPLVHCTLMAAPEWGARRDAYREAIERYLVKGAQLLCKVLDTHYTGSLLLRLYQVDGATFPAAGEAIVLRNPNGQEQYVRVLKVTVAQATFTESLGGVITSFVANIATCELAQELAFDVLGAAATKISAITLARVYSTTPATGAKFYAIKPLASAASVGDAAVTLAGGIYTPIIPAATSETPLIDQVPHGARRGLSRTAIAAVTLPPVNLILQPGAVLFTTGPVEPGSASFSAGATAFSDDGAGALRQGATSVGTVDYAAGKIEISAGAPTYGAATVALSYRPATISNSPQRSDSMPITLANVGRSFVYQFAPAPAPGSFALSFMAQGRWYDLLDNGNGQIRGADNSYGSGTISYATGSAAFTLGAIPDVGSDLIYSWGDGASAVAPLTAGLPVRAYVDIDLGPYAYNSDYAFSWSRGAITYAAIFHFSSGLWTGDATGAVPHYDRDAATWRVRFEPSTLPDSDILVASTKTNLTSTAVTGGAGGNYTLTNTPVQKRSVSFTAIAAPAPGIVLYGGLTTLIITDNGDGVLYDAHSGASVGTVNYSTGALVLLGSHLRDVQELVVASYVASSGNTLYYDNLITRIAQSVAINNTTAASFTYVVEGATSTASAVAAPSFRIDVPTPAPKELNSGSLLFSFAGDLYSAAGGVLRKGWSAATGVAAVANAGVVSSSGSVTISSAPSGAANTVVWYNAALAATSGYVSRGVFRLASAPIKVGNFQMRAGSSVASGDNAGVLSGGGVTGTVDYSRGIVRWNRNYSAGTGLAGWFTAALPSGAIGGAAISFAQVPGYIAPVSASGYLYNAVFLQYLPLNSAVLGLDTSRLPLDGRVPAYRAGDLVVVHNTLSTQLPNPLTKGNAYNLGRVRLAYAKVRTAAGATVDEALYTTDLDLGTLTVPVASNITALAQPWTVEHRIEDMVVVSEADISGKLKFTRAVTHDYPANTSYASSALIAGDVFGRVSNVFDQGSWTGAWSDERIGSDTAASYNTIDYPLQTTNRGAVTERWALIFTSNTAFRIVGEKYGQVGTGDINTVTTPNNTAVAAPFFTISPLGWGGGWAAGNVLRLNTYACGAAIGIVRTVLQGPDSVASDQFTVGFRGNVNA